jgi:aminoglycoside phosphotransferase (APT) family kinase protein
MAAAARGAGLGHAGDLHPGNLLVDRDAVSGIIDWNNVVLAPPEYDLAVTGLILSIIAGNLPALFAASQDFGAGVAEASIARYRAHRRLDDGRLDYYTVLQAALPLIEVAALRRDPRLRAEITEGEAWQRAKLIAPVRDTVARLTGIPIELVGA